MRTTYLVLARIIAALVVIQAMTIVFAVAGLFTWAAKPGNALDASTMESWETTPPTFTGALGHGLHLITGERVLPVVALLMLIVAFFAKVQRGVLLALVLLALIVLQAYTGIAGHGMPYLGLWHGLGAFLIFGAAMAAAMSAKKSADAPVAA